LAFKVVVNLSPATTETAAANCGTSNVDPHGTGGAVRLPCHASSLPAGRKQGHAIESGRATFWLDSDRAGKNAVEVSLHPPDKCALTGASEVPSDEPGMRRFERPDQLPPRLRATRLYVFSGGCVTYRFEFDSAETASLLFDADGALAFERRTELVGIVRGRNGLSLCGADAPPCSGESS
jgi:hypothetical protein